MPLQATSGAASYDAFGGGVAAVPNYIEECFSTYLYTGNSSSQTITNGIDLAGKGGLVWIKSRQNAYSNYVADTARGANRALRTDMTSAERTDWTDELTAFNSTGFTLGASSNGFTNNNSIGTYASWTFRKQPKFFDVVTWTGDGNAKTINHSLGSTPGCIIIKATSTTSSWGVYHRSVTGYGLLNLTNAWTTPSIVTATTDTTFSIIAGWNDPSVTYVAYLFAHNAGGFGLTGTDNVISCGSFTTDGSGNTTVILGYEPQWVLIKQINDTGGWLLFDTMRGWSMSNDARLMPNNTLDEYTGADFGNPTSTGFKAGPSLSASGTFIYIAIRRPMKVPTSGTSVFSPISVNNSTGTQNTTGFPVDLQIARNKANGEDTFFYDRLRGVNTTDVTDASKFLTSVSTAAEASALNRTRNWGSTGYFTPANFNEVNAIYWNFKRAPSFFDEVCYTGDSTLGRAVPHNLGAVPELMIVKNRNNTENWVVYSATTGATKRLILNSTVAAGVRAVWADTTPTATNFYVGGSGVLGETNYTTYTYVAYLFATCAGVSKVGSYTGTGTTKQVDCGFTSGARFVLIKRTDSTGDWYVWDSARGIVAGNDPYLLLNSTAAEVTSTDYIDTYSAGFEISSTAPAAINASGGTFIFLAIA